MKPILTNTWAFAIYLLVFLGGASTQSIAGPRCTGCHVYEPANWPLTKHANTQTNVAYGLARDYVGKTPSEVVYGPGGQNCIACHGPTTVLTNSLTELEAMSLYFTTESGRFTSNTAVVNSADWPHVACQTCHYIPARHSQNPSFLGLFDSTRKEYSFMPSATALCAQCHGDVRHTNSTQRVFNAWNGSPHRQSQESVAEGLRTKHAGKTPEQVIAEENCIACHAPRAAVGTTEAIALGTYFSTTNGVFSSATAAVNTQSWQGIDCTSCHDPHAPGLAYFNSTTQWYEPMANADQLCGQCHGTLQFSKSRYRSYDVLKQIGGIGITNQQVMASLSCVDCHMHSGTKPGSNAKEFHGHSWAITIQEADGSTTTSCTGCHPSLSTYASHALINAWKTEFQYAAGIAQTNVARAVAALGGSSDPAIQAALAEAQQNLSLALADESGGAHNPTYLMALVKAANDRVLGLGLPILTAGRYNTNVFINWTGGTLQQADQPTGLWQDLTNAVPPLLIPPAEQAPRKFYRLKN